MIKYLNIEEKKFNKIFAIGDIHGNYFCLEQLQSRITKTLKNGDIVIFLGDYIDRGHQSFEVVDYILDIMSEYPEQVFPLRGNHELMLKDVIEHTYYGKHQFHITDWIYNGGEQTRRSYVANLSEKPQQQIYWYELDKWLPANHREFYESKLYDIIESDKHIFVHAGINSEKELKYQTLETLVWDRSFYKQPIIINSEKTFVIGHTPVYDNKPVVITENEKIHIINLDGGIGKSASNGYLLSAEFDRNQNLFIESIGV